MLMKQLAIKHLSVAKTGVWQCSQPSPTMYRDVPLLTSTIPRFLSEAHILEFVPNHVCDGRQCYTKTDAKNGSSRYSTFLSGYCHCRETLHSCNPPASKWRNTIQSKSMFAYFGGVIVGQKTKHLVDLTPFKQPLRSFLATELKPQNQTPRSLGHH